MAIGPALRPAQAPGACLANARHDCPSAARPTLSNELEPPLGGGAGEPYERADGRYRLLSR